MHYVRFLKQPTLRQTPNPGSKKRGSNGVQKPRLSIHALITLETDLGDSIFYGDVGVTCTVFNGAKGRDKAPQSQQVSSIEVSWSGGMRSLAVEVPLSGLTAKELAAASLRLRVGPSRVKSEDDEVKSRLQDDQLVMPIVIPQISALINVDGSAASGRVQVARPLAMGTDLELVIEEDAGVSMARHVWDAGVALVALLAEMVQNDYQSLAQTSKLIKSATRDAPLNVLELGAGVGTAGVAFATLVPNTKVTITDVSEAEKLVALNIASNKAAKNSTVSFATLDWSEEVPSEILGQSFDVVLVADCIYNEDSIPALVITLSSLARTSPDMVVLVATKTRHSSEAIFFDLVKKEQLKVVAQTSVLAPAGVAEEDLQEAERIDMYEFVVSKD